MTPYPGGRREIHEVFARPAAANNVIACTAQTGELGQLYVSDDAGELLSGGTDGQRLILYIGSPGGFVSSLPGAQADAALGTIPGRGRLSGAGIYRLTILLPTDRLYLPVVSR